MGQSNRRWIIRDASGQIDGPFTTEKVLYKIGRGEFSGEESIAHYPDGKWIPISQDPQFYDKLLEVLSDDENEESREETRVLEFTRPQNTEVHAAAPPPPPEVEDTQPGEQTKTPTPKKLNREGASRARRRRRKKPVDIELVDTRPEVWREVLRRARLPLLVVAGGLAIGSIFYFNTSTNEERIHLIGPQKNIRPESPESLLPKARQGVSEFLKDTLEGYLHAENDFVNVVERNPHNSDVMALLCMTYLQLWPYSHQDSGDTKVVATLVKMSMDEVNSSMRIDAPPGDQVKVAEATRLQNAAKVHSATCRAVDLIVRGRFPEAKSLVEGMLDAHTNATNPPIIFYFLKGFLLEGANDHASAVGYLRSAEQLWPQWLLAYVTEASAQAKLEKYSEAANIYRRVLQINPHHTVSRIELGLLEYKYFNHLDQAEHDLNQALDSDGAPRATLSRGYFGLAEIALKRNDQRRALRFAQKAFSLNSSNNSAKNLIVQLGGVEKLKNTKVKGKQLLFEGDQFAREGDYHAAQAHYKAAFEEDPKNALAALKAAQSLWKLSFSTEAIDWLKRAIVADPNLIEAYVTMAEYLASRYDFLAATRILEAAKHVNPKSHEVFRGFATVELKRGNPAGAISFGKMAMQLYENDVETQILMAQASLALKEYTKAFNYASKAIEIDVNHRKAQIVYADSLAGTQGIDVGVEYYLKLVNNYPLVTEYRLGLGKMLLADERYGNAEEVFRQITKLDEKPKEAYVELAKVLRAQGSMGEALDLLFKAAVLDPSDAEPLYLAGIIYLELKKPAEAKVQFQRVLTINKLFPLVHYQLGRAALILGNPAEALDQTEAEKRSNPNLPDAFLLAAEAHTQMQQYTNCATEYQKAIKLRPQRAFIYVKNAQCYRKAGNLDAAGAMLTVASSKEAGLADIYKEQGAIYEVKGDVNHAIEAYQQYFVLDPDAPDRAQIEERISALQHGQTP